MPKKALFFG